MGEARRRAMAAPPPPVEPDEALHWVVARTLWDEGSEPGDPPWLDLDDDERAAWIDLAERTMEVHLRIMAGRDFRVIPPGAVQVPKGEAEAWAMAKAAKAYLDARARKAGLLAKPASGLILPNGRPM